MSLFCPARKGCDPDILDCRCILVCSPLNIRSQSEEHRVDRISVLERGIFQASSRGPLTVHSTFGSVAKVRDISLIQSTTTIPARRVAEIWVALRHHRRSGRSPCRDTACNALSGNGLVRPRKRRSTLPERIYHSSHNRRPCLSRIHVRPSMGDRVRRVGLRILASRSNDRNADVLRDRCRNRSPPSRPLAKCELWALDRTTILQDSLLADFHVRYSRCQKFPSVLPTL